MHLIDLIISIFNLIILISFVLIDLTCLPIGSPISLIRLLVLHFDLCKCRFDYSGLLFVFRILLSAFEFGFDVLGLLPPFRFLIGRFEESVL